MLNRISGQLITSYRYLKRKLHPHLKLLLLGIITFATAFQASSITLAWDFSTSEDVNAYKLYYGTESGNYTEVLEVGNTNQATVSELSPARRTISQSRLSQAPESKVDSLPRSFIPYRCRTPPIWCSSSTSKTRSFWKEPRISTHHTRFRPLRILLNGLLSPRSRRVRTEAFSMWIPSTSTPPPGFIGCKR